MHTRTRKPSQTFALYVCVSPFIITPSPPISPHPQTAHFPRAGVGPGEFLPSSGSGPAPTSTWVSSARLAPIASKPRARHRAGPLMPSAHSPEPHHSCVTASQLPPRRHAGCIPISMETPALWPEELVPLSYFHSSILFLGRRADKKENQVIKIGLENKKSSSLCSKVWHCQACQGVSEPEKLLYVLP